MSVSWATITFRIVGLPYVSEVPVASFFGITEFGSATLKMEADSSLYRII